MEKKHKKIPWRGYLVSCLLAGAVSIAILLCRDIFHMTTALDRFRILCDAFFIPGILLTCFGVMVLVSNAGFFYVFNYSIKLFVDRFTKDRKFKKTYQTYYDYFSVKTKEEKPSVNYVIHVGLAFIGVAFLFNIGFYSQYL